MTDRHELRYGVFRPVLVLLGMGRRHTFVEVGPDEVRVQMGWAFRARIPREHVVSARRDRDFRWGIGVHGWAGRWLVNGSVTGIVTVEIDPPVRARVIGWPVRLRMLHVSLRDPDGFLATCAPS